MAPGKSDESMGASTYMTAHAYVSFTLNVHMDGTQNTASNQCKRGQISIEEWTLSTSALLQHLEQGDAGYTIGKC